MATIFIIIRLCFFLFSVMLHQPHYSQVYLWLFTNSLLVASLGIGLPYLILKEARTLRYMQNLKAKLFARLMASTLVVLGMCYLLDIINEHLLSIELLHSFMWFWAAIFVFLFTLTSWLNRKALGSLYPQEDFVFEQRRHQQLLQKLNACDEAMPLPRFESKHGKIIAANRAAQELLELNVVEMHKLAPGAIVHEDDRARVLQLLLEQSTETFECRIFTASGRMVTVEVHSLNDPNDAEVRISFLTDVTKYVEQRDRYVRDLRLSRSTAERRVAEEGLLSDLIGQSQGITSLT